ncbi:Fc.00g026540.m01.CDS01 [Cosmosporella sp. VM-42]
MERVELMLEKVVEKLSQVRNPEHPLSSASATPQPPHMALFDDGLRQQVEANTFLSPPQSVSFSNFSPRTGTTEGSPTERIEKIRQRLAAMLPCQEDVDCLSDLSHGWWLIRRHMMPHLLKIPDDDLRKPFNVSTVSKSHPMAIARLLLAVAISIQQLPPNIDLRRLQTKTPLRGMMEEITAFISQSVTCDDDLTGCIEGIECLALQGIFQVNDGNLRRSWLSFRKAISVAQLMGLQRVSSKTSQQVSDVLETKRHHLWHQIVQGERYLSLILGIPSATGSAPFPFDDDAPWLSTEELYHKHLCQISGLILARNQGNTTHSFSATHEIDEKLDDLAKRMPKVWWETPTAIIEGRTEEAASQFERMMCHIWHFELLTLLHLPFMLRAATDRRYEYSRVSCLSASRNLIRRWMVIRETHGKTLFSNLVEFQAFTAAVTLLLGLLGPTRSTIDLIALKEQHSDQQLVETVVQIFEGLKQRGAVAHVANQSVSIIRTLQSVLGHEGNSPSSLRLEIPYFGTISVSHGGNVQSLEGERILGSNPSSNTEINPPVQARRSDLAPLATGIAPTQTSVSIPTYEAFQSADGDGEGLNGNDVWMNNSVLRFASSQFPMSEPLATNSTTTEWPLQECDTILFDSLLNTDLEGNWDF